MFVDLIGKVRNTYLPRHESLFPLFEAVINSFQSIESLNNKSNSYIQITLERDNDLVKSIIVEDNGIGFNNSNFKSFNTVDSKYKSFKGCLGIGRFKWLKAFENVKIESTYMENKIFLKRIFTFNLKNRDQIYELSTGKWDGDIYKTVVNLENLKNEYKEHFPINADEISLKLIEHCLPYFIYRKNISVTLKDGDNLINLNEMFANTMKLDRNIVKFSVKDNDFEIVHIFEANSIIKENILSVCANNREVKTYKISDYITDLTAKIKIDEKEERYYHGYIYGGILDKNVNNERLDFNLDSIELENIIDESIKIIHDYLKKYLKPDSQNKIDKIEATKNGSDESAKKENGYYESAEKENVVSKSSLVKYISQRKIVLDLLKSSVTMNKNGNDILEEYVHKVIFPLKNKLSEVTFENHNLWLMDEKLTYYSYLGCNNASLKEDSDIFVINNPICIINEEDKPYSSLSIIYFNKPMKVDYNSINPIDDILKYISDLRSGKALDRLDRTIAVDDSIINVYLISDLNFELLEIMESRDFMIASDKLEYSLYHRNLKALIRVISYDKMIQDAISRNKVLVDKLFS